MTHPIRARRSTRRPRAARSPRPNSRRPNTPSSTRPTPQENDRNGQTWYARGQNFIIAYTEAEPGATFARKGQIDEYVVLLHDAPTTAEITAGAEKKSIGGYTVELRSAGRQQRDLAEGRAARAHVHDALGRPRGEVLERGGLRQAASEHSAVPGLAGAEGRLQDPQLQPRRAAARKAASAASSAAPPSW